MAEVKFDVFSFVTDKIIAAIEAGCPPWRKPWTGSTGGVCFPLRASGEPYRGINVLMLWMEASEKGYVSPRWCTYKQATDLGGQVRKGEKATTVIKYGTFEKEDSKTGEDKTFAYAKAYRVFNADQIEGLPVEFYGAPSESPRDLGTKEDPTLSSFFGRIGATITHSEDPRAYYNSTKDFIHMPEIATFHSVAGYYGTLAHEVIHWTGHKTRLDRLASNNARQAYAFEELIAEIGNCMLCATLGLTPDFDQSGAYVAGWLEALAKDSRMIFAAASQAQKAVDYITAAAVEKMEVAA